MKKLLFNLFYRFICFLARLLFPKFKLSGTENLPDEACVIVGNHAQMNGPVAAQLYHPRSKYIWCIGEMMNIKEVPDYAFQDFWSKKPRMIRWFYRLLSYLIAPIASVIFNNADTIPVYKDTRVMTTFRKTMKGLSEGKDIIIFPEQEIPYNNIVYDFQEHFADLGKMYYRKTGKQLKFIPMYLCPRLSLIVFGEPVIFDPVNKASEERIRICHELMDRITDLAVDLPEHTVVPYPNIPKKEYPKNRPLTDFRETA